MPKIRYQYLTKKSEIAMTTSVGPGRSAPKAREYLLERRNHENHDDGRDDEGDTDNRNRIEQRRLDLALDGEDFFLVGREALEQGVENTGLLAGADQVAEQRVEIKRVLFERAFKVRAGFHVGLDRHQELLHPCVAVAFADDVERLQQRHAGFHHGCELAREKRDVLLGDGAAATHFDFLDLEDLDALPAQRRVDEGLAACAHFAAHGLAGLVGAGPGKSKFLDVFLGRGSGGSGHKCFPHKSNLTNRLDCKPLP